MSIEKKEKLNVRDHSTMIGDSFTSRFGHCQRQRLCDSGMYVANHRSAAHANSIQLHSLNGYCGAHLKCAIQRPNGFI